MDGCMYCNEDLTDNGVTSKDIVFKYLKCNPFGIEDEEYNPDITLYVNEFDATLNLTVMLGDYVISKDEIKINYCPFCGRRLRNE